MKKRILTFLTLLVAFFGLIGLTTNNYAVINAEETSETLGGDQATVDYDLSVVKNGIPSSAIASFPVTYESVYGNEIKWSVQAEQEIITYDEEAHWMVVNRPESGETQYIEITVTIKGLGEAAATHTFTVAVSSGVTVTKQYDIKYNLDGGTNHTDNPTKYNVGQATIELLDPTKEGYTFDGWYQGGEKVEKILVGSMQDYELTAHWERNEYTISFDSKGGSNVNIITGNFGDEITAPNAPTKEGHTFAGWYENENYEGEKFEFNTMPSKNVTLYAKWTVEQYTIKFMDGEGEFATITQNFGTSITAPTTDKEGHTFVEWQDKQGVQLYVPSTMPAENLVYYGKWTVNQYTIKFMDGNTVVETITQYFGTSITAPTTDKEGYEFKKWDQEIPTTMPAKNLVINGTWEILSYTVTFKNGDDQYGEVLTLTYGSKVQFPTDPTAEAGKSFIGWAYNGQKVDEKTFTVPAKNIELTAIWSDLELYTITFDSNGGTIIDKQEVYAGSNVVAPKEPTKTGYTFVSWVNENDEEVEFPFAATADLTLKAKYEINKYTVTFKDHDGKELDKQEIEYLGSAVAPANPTREGYTFKGWDKAFTAIKADLEVVAQYEINKYTVVFKDHDGTELSKQEVEYLSDAVAPADPTRTGYTFKGWDKAFTAIKADLEVVAQYEINKYAVVFKDYDGTILSEQEVEYLSAALAPADPTRTGYTFKGWDKAFDAVSADIEVTAQYDINKFTVVFKDYDGTVLETQTVEYLGDAVAPADPTRTGYTFKGWDKAFTAISADLEVTAQYSINKYAVVFKIDGKVVSSATLEYGATITAPEVQEIEEYTFSGWTPEVAETVPAHDVVYEGSYIPDIMAEHIANKMVESMETLTEQNLEAQIKAANELVSDLGGTVIWTPQNTIVSIDQNGNVTYVYPQTATEVIIEATVSYDGDIDSTAYRTFTVKIYPLKSATDENTKVTVENMTNGSQLTVSEVTDTSNIVVENGEKEVLVAYDINVTENGQKVEGNYIVKLPAPENTNAPYYIYHIAEGQEPALVATVEELTGGYIVFETTHFSVYAIVVDKEVEGDEPTQETTESLNIFGKTGTLASESLSISWEGTNIKFVTEKSSSQTPIRTSDADHFRVYQGTKTTISCVDGSVITKVVITTTESSYAKALVDFTVTGGKATADGIIVTIEAESNATAIVISADAQWRLSKIEVTYGGQSGSTPEQPTHEHTACPECAKCTAADCNGTDADKCQGHEVEPEHEHTACPECGKCTSSDCDGAESEKCPGHEQTEQPAELKTSYTFANYTAGTQYAKNEEHVLDSDVTITTTEAHFTSELRLYSSDTHNGYAIIKVNGKIEKFGFNAGNKADTLNVYGSTDGITWTLIEGVSIISTYKDYEVDMSNASYTYLKLDVAGSNQVRLKSMTITFEKNN